MPVTLVNPKKAILLDSARIAAVKIENNPRQGTRWIDVFVVYGHVVDGAWVQSVDPADGSIAQYYRIAPGENPHARPAFAGSDPAASGSPLGQCGECGAWDLSRRAGSCACGGAVKPYDGFQRLCASDPSGPTMYAAIKRAVYRFLITEEVPDPVTGDVRPLLAATVE